MHQLESGLAWLRFSTNGLSFSFQLENNATKTKRMWGLRMKGNGIFYAEITADYSGSVLLRFGPQLRVMNHCWNESAQNVKYWMEFWQTRKKCCFTLFEVTNGVGKLFVSGFCHLKFLRRYVFNFAQTVSVVPVALHFVSVCFSVPFVPTTRDSNSVRKKTLHLFSMKLSFRFPNLHWTKKRTQKRKIFLEHLFFSGEKMTLMCLCVVLCVLPWYLYDMIRRNELLVKSLIKRRKNVDMIFWHVINDSTSFIQI